LALEDKKLHESMALLKKQKEDQKVALETKRKDEEKLRKIAEDKATKEEEQTALVLAKKKEEERLLLLKKEEAIYAAKKEEEEKKRLALLEKKRLEEKRRLEEQKKLANQNFLTDKEEVIELEKLDLFESDQISDELSLFRQDKKEEKTTGFKPLEDWCKFSVGYSTTVENLGKPNSGREALKGTVTINPHSYYFFGMTSSLDLNGYNNPFYQPDFSYSFGYSDWHLDTFSWNYSNYANNKFSPKEGEDRFNFGKGNWELSYKTKVDDVTLTAKGKYVTETDTKKLNFKQKKMS